MCGPWMRCRFVTTMSRCATAGTVAQLSAPALSSWIHFRPWPRSMIPGVQSPIRTSAPATASVMAAKFLKPGTPTTSTPGAMPRSASAISTSATTMRFGGAQPLRSRTGVGASRSSKRSISAAAAAHRLSQPAAGWAGVRAAGIASAAAAISAAQNRLGDSTSVYPTDLAQRRASSAKRRRPAKQ